MLKENIKAITFMGEKEVNKSLPNEGNYLTVPFFVSYGPRYTTKPAPSFISKCKSFFKKLII